MTSQVTLARSFTSQMQTLEKGEACSHLNTVPKMPPVGVINVIRMHLATKVCLSHSPLWWYTIHFQSPQLNQWVAVAWDGPLFPPSIDTCSLWMPAIWTSRTGGLAPRPSVYPAVLRSSWTPWKRSSTLPTPMVSVKGLLFPQNTWCSNL